MKAKKTHHDFQSFCEKVLITIQSSTDFFQLCSGCLLFDLAYRQAEASTKQQNYNHWKMYKIGAWFYTSATVSTAFNV